MVHNIKDFFDFNGTVKYVHCIRYDFIFAYISDSHKEGDPQASRALFYAVHAFKFRLHFNLSAIALPIKALDATQQFIGQSRDKKQTVPLCQTQYRDNLMWYSKVKCKILKAKPRKYRGILEVYRPEIAQALEKH